MSNAILRHLVLVSFLFMGAFAAALPPAGTAPPPPPPPPPAPTPIPQIVAPPVQATPMRVPSAASPTFWIQCPSWYLPTGGGTAPAISFATEGGSPGKLLPNGASIPAKPPDVLVIRRYLDASSPQFAALVNRMPQGCTLTAYTLLRGTAYTQEVFSGAFLVSITAGTTEQTLYFHFTELRYLMNP